MRTFVPAVAAALLMTATPGFAQDDQGSPAAPPPSGGATNAGPPAAPPLAVFPYGPSPKVEPAAKPAAKPGASPPQAPSKPQAAPRPAASALAPPSSARPAPGARLQPGQPIPAAELETFVDGQVRAAMARDHLAGVAVAVVQNGQVLLKKGYGFASLAPRRPVDPDRTLFRLGAVSSTFTWIGVMKEVEAGRIRLEQPINLYLPEKVQVRDQGFARPVRLVDLMSHAAGFEDRALGSLYERDADYVRPLEVYLRQERPARVRAPGETASFTDYDAGLAGEAASWVSGKPFERLMEEEIFLPLGLSHTTFRERRRARADLPAPMPADLAAGAADGVRWTAEGFETEPYEYLGQIAPAEAASSSAGDMARFMLALLGGGRFESAQIYGPLTAEAFRTPILPAPEGVNGWAHGFRIEALPGGHKGYGETGATLASVANLTTAPDLGLGVFVAANSASGAALAAELPRSVVREFYALAEPFPRPDAPVLREQADLYAGRYLTTRRAYSGLAGFVGRLTGIAHVRIAGAGRLVVAETGRSRVWTPEGPAESPIFRGLRDEDRLVFRMSGGRAAAFETGAGDARYERVGFWRSPTALCLFASLAAAAAALTLIGAALRKRRELRESLVQSRASLVQNIQAGLWLTALGAFALWAARTLPDPERLALGWPGPWLVAGSACSLVAAVLTGTTLFALPAVWRGGRRVDTWPILRRISFTLTVLIYAVFSYLLARAGALAPWMG